MHSGSNHKTPLQPLWIRREINMSTASQVAAKKVYACILNVMSMCITGNHETTTCTTMYGFKVELDRKFGNQDAKLVYQTCKRVFSHLPLAAIISDSALVVHGGLFRKPARLASTKVSFQQGQAYFWLLFHRKAWLLPCHRCWHLEASLARFYKGKERKDIDFSNGVNNKKWWHVSHMRERLWPDVKSQKPEKSMSA